MIGYPVLSDCPSIHIRFLTPGERGFTSAAKLPVETLNGARIAHIFVPYPVNVGVGYLGTVSCLEF